MGNRDQHSNKESKKKAQLSMKEKRLAKKMKKETRGNTILEHNSN